jgi:hypothetical protein
MNRDHIAGLTVGLYAYQKRGCRCPGCCAAERRRKNSPAALRVAQRARRPRKGEPTLLRASRLPNRVEIEIAIARGLRPSQIMAKFGVPYELVAKVRDYMERVNEAAS